jgi:hypothetical protein
MRGHRAAFIVAAYWLTVRIALAPLGHQGGVARDLIIGDK